MKTNRSRREFLAKSSRIGLICGALACLPKILPFGSLMREDEIPDPKKLNYCGHTCPPDCLMKKATLENNAELKKEAYKNWRIESKYGIAFDPEKIPRSHGLTHWIRWSQREDLNLQPAGASVD